MPKPFLHHDPSPSEETMVEGLLSSDLLETLPDAIVAVDHDGTIVQVNSQAHELFGYDRGELIGQKVEILVPESYRGETPSSSRKIRRSSRRPDGWERNWTCTEDGVMVRSSLSK